MSSIATPQDRRRLFHVSFDETRNIITENLRQHFAHGVLAVRDGGDAGAHTLRYRKECLCMERAICLKSPGRAWHAPGRYGSIIGRAPAAGQSLADSIAGDADRVDHVKIVNSGLNSLARFGEETPPQFNLTELKAAVDAAGNLDLKTMVHANGRVPVSLAIEAGCHSVEHGFFMGRENLQEMADRQVTWVPTACTMQAYSKGAKPGRPEAEIAKRNLDHQIEQIALARTLGVPVALGTDSGSPGVLHGMSIWREFSLFLEAGFSMEEAVRCGTLNGARLLGVSHELGSLRPGMPATFIALRSDPSSLAGPAGRIEGVYVRGERMSWPVEEP
jgi:predicted amidohydrolase